MKEEDEKVEHHLLWIRTELRQSQSDNLLYFHILKCFALCDVMRLGTFSLSTDFCQDFYFFFFFLALHPSLTT